MTNTVWTMTEHFDSDHSAQRGIFASSKGAAELALCLADDHDRVVVRSIKTVETVLKEKEDPECFGSVWVIQEIEVRA